MSLLFSLVDIVREHSLPIAFGYARKRNQAPKEMPSDGNSVQAWNHTIAYFQCVVQVERFMREQAQAREIGIVVAEDTPNSRSRIKALHRNMSDPRLRGFLSKELREVLPLSRSIDTPHFASKQDAALLQIADVCAFVFTRFLSGGRHIEEHYKRLMGATHRPENLGEPDATGSGFLFRRPGLVISARIRGEP